MDTSKDIRELLFEVLDSEMEQTVDYSNVDALLQVFKEYIEEKRRIHDDAEDVYLLDRFKDNLLEGLEKEGHE